MCLIAIAYRVHPDYPLLVAANRDEYHERPTRCSGFWEAAPQLLAGKDLIAGGTWMGITREGRFAAITNHRNPPGTPEEPRSRGLLTLDYLLGSKAPADYLQTLARDATAYAGFNLLLGDGDGLWYLSNIEQRVRELEPGVHSVSNATLDSTWPKQELARRAMHRALQDRQRPSIAHDTLQAVVASRELVADPLLPDTGIHIDMERMLSAQFIVSANYGTRATTSLRLRANGEFSWREDNFDEHGQLTRRVEEDVSPGGRG